VLGALEPPNKVLPPEAGAAPNMVPDPEAAAGLLAAPKREVPDDAAPNRDGVFWLDENMFDDVPPKRDFDGSDMMCDGCECKKTRMQRPRQEIGNAQNWIGSERGLQDKSANTIQRTRGRWLTWERRLGNVAEAGR